MPGWCVSSSCVTAARVSAETVIRVALRTLATTVCCGLEPSTVAGSPGAACISRRIRSSVAASIAWSICKRSITARASAEDRLVAVGGDRDEEDLDHAQLVVLDGVDSLRQRRVRTPLEDERERRAAARLVRDLGGFDELRVERRGVAGSDPEAVSAQRLEVGGREGL